MGELFLNSPDLLEYSAASDAEPDSDVRAPQYSIADSTVH